VSALEKKKKLTTGAGFINDYHGLSTETSRCTVLSSNFEFLDMRIGLAHLLTFLFCRFIYETSRRQPSTFDRDDDFLLTNRFWAAGTGLASQQPLLYQITAQAHTEFCFW